MTIIVSQKCLAPPPSIIPLLHYTLVTFSYRNMWNSSPSQDLQNDLQNLNDLAHSAWTFSLNKVIFSSSTSQIIWYLFPVGSPSYISLSVTLYHITLFIFYFMYSITISWLPRWLRGKESTCRSRRYMGLIPRLGRSPGGGNGNWLQ